eukprot:s3628_g4.t1
MTHDTPELAEEDLELESVTVCGRRFRIHRRRSNGTSAADATGLVLWECALLLAEYLGYGLWRDSRDRSPASPASPARSTSTSTWWQLHPPAPVVPARFWRTQPAVLELGGGCGLVTLALVSLGARVVYTDGDAAVLRLAQRNCAETAMPRSRCHFRRLRFGDQEAAKSLLMELGPFGHVVGSDLIYGAGFARRCALLDTLQALAEAQEMLEVKGSRTAAPFLVTLAIKNRCCDEVELLIKEALEREIWTLRRAETSALPESFQQEAEAFYGPPGRPSYCVVHLRFQPRLEPPSKKKRT